MRTAISVAILAVALWAAFAVDLGTQTFAEHIDTISDTPEAKQLVDDTRATINPALMEVRDRVLGEYVEAPTWIPEPPASAASEADSSTKPGTDASAVGRMVREAKSRRKPITDKHDAEPPLPGRPTVQHTASLRGEHAPPLPGQARPPSSGSEPPLPGQP